MQAKEARPTLQEIGEQYRCDKFVTHRFADMYERHFAPFRDRSVKLLEIGIGDESAWTGGASLLTWQDYFSKAQIYGIDIFCKSFLDNDRITTAICDQGNQLELAAFEELHGPFDIIIDDGSHKAPDTLNSLFYLFHRLKDGGIYVIEDLQTSYWPQYGGTSIAGDFIDTPIRWLKLMIDCINTNEILWDEHPAKLSGFLVSEIHFYRNIAFIFRGSENQKSNVLTAENRRTWLATDFCKHGLSKEFALKMNCDPDFQKKIIKIFSELSNIFQPDH